MEQKLKRMCNLINDRVLDRVSLYSKKDCSDKEMGLYSDEAVRQGFFDILGEDKLTWRGWRNHKNEIFTIMEEVINTNIPQSYSPFYDQFVEMKNGALGDKNEFVVEDNSVLVATSFSGNHWDTDRKKLPGKKSFSLDTEWIYVHVYDDFERFLKGIITLPDLVAKMQQAMRNAVNDRIFTSFNAAGTYLPQKFKKTGAYDRKSMLELIQTVQTASGRNVVIAGTKVALSYIAEGAITSYISEEQKREMAANGVITSYTQLGVPGFEIPQAFIRGTYNFKVNNKLLYVLPDNERFVKVWFEGDTRARELGYTDTHDQTVDTQIQTKIGVGTVFSTLFGTWELA